MTTDADREKADLAAILARLIRERDEQIGAGLEHADPRPLADGFVALAWSRGWRPTPGMTIRPRPAGDGSSAGAPDAIRSQLAAVREQCAVSPTRVHVAEPPVSEAS